MQIKYLHLIKITIYSSFDSISNAKAYSFWCNQLNCLMSVLIENCWVWKSIQHKSCRRLWNGVGRSGHWIGAGGGWLNFGPKCKSARAVGLSAYNPNRIASTMWNANILYRTTLKIAILFVLCFWYNGVRIKCGSLVYLTSSGSPKTCLLNAKMRKCY